MDGIINVELEQQHFGLSCVLEVETSPWFNVELETEQRSETVVVTATPPMQVEIMEEEPVQRLWVGVGDLYPNGGYLTTVILDALPIAGDPTVLYQIRKGNGKYAEYMWTENHWNLIGVYSWNDIEDIPEDLVYDGDYVHTDNNYTDEEKEKLEGIEAGAEVNVQADWNQTNTTADDYIKNKPTLPDAPGTLDTTNTEPQATAASEPLSGNVKLHKIAKTGRYADLVSKPDFLDVAVENVPGNTAYRLRFHYRQY